MHFESDVTLWYHSMVIPSVNTEVTRLGMFGDVKGFFIQLQMKIFSWCNAYSVSPDNRYLLLTSTLL